MFGCLGLDHRICPVVGPFPPVVGKNKILSPIPRTFPKVLNLHLGLFSIQGRDRADCTDETGFELDRARFSIDDERGFCVAKISG